MGLEFLVRVRRSSLWVALVGALWAATYLGLGMGLAVLLGAVWSVVNLILLERLVVALTGPDRRDNTALRRLGLAAFGMVALFAMGGLLLSKASPIGALAGFLIPIGVIVLKAATLL